MVNLAIIIVTFNTQELTKKCLQSIFQKKSKINFEVLLIDNSSSDQTLDMVKQDFPQVRLIKSPKNLGFAGGNNLALKKIKAPFVLLLNSDTEVEPNSIEELFEFSKQSNFDIVSCKLVDKNGQFQPNAGELPTFWPTFFWISGLDDILGKFMTVLSYQERDSKYYVNNREVGWVSGSVMLIKQSVFEKIGLLDENIFMYGEDVDFCLRAKKARFNIGWTDKSTIYHLGGGSSRDHKYKQWSGEFKGLLYLYGKHFGNFQKIILKSLIYFFVLARILVFGILGRFGNVKAYAKVFITI